MTEDFNTIPTASSGGSLLQKPSPPANAPHALAGLNPRSCVTCRRRKVKCDKKEPCGNCTRARIDCIFPSPGRAPRKSRKPQDGELLDRLRKLESVVQSLGAQVDEETSPKTVSAVNDESENFQQFPTIADNLAQEQRTESNQRNGASPSADTPGLNNKFGRLVVTEGKSRYINSSFWANLNSEVEDLKEIFNEDSDEGEEDTPSPSSNLSNNRHQSFVFGYSSANVDLYPLHPSPDLLPRYWNYFKENVDPLAKFLHIPTIEQKILESPNRATSLPKGLEALLFAIYYSVVTSLTPGDCIQELGEQRETLLNKYRFGVEQALARAHFLDSQEMIVLQAFVLFLICLRRNDDARIIWTLTGMVVRIAQTIGIHRDGEHFDITPFEIEMRRRLWWQVCILDFRSSEDHGSDPTISEAQYDTKMPLNVNDTDLYPSMKKLPEPRKGFTDMTFCIIRFEVGSIFRRIVYVPPGPVKCTSFFSDLTIEQKEKWITDCHQRLEDTYLKDCDMTMPLSWVTATISRLVLSKMWLVVYHPYQRFDGGASLPREIKDKLFITSLESVEYSILLETEKRTRRWEWLFKTYVQWHSLAFMLSELCTRTRGDTVERAWRAIEATVASRFPSTFSDSSKAYLWRPLRKLMVKARAARERELARERAELQSQAQLNGVTLQADFQNTFASPTESYPVIDALLHRSSNQWGSPSPDLAQSQKILTPTNSNPTSSPPIPNDPAQEFNQMSNLGMDWLVGDLQQDNVMNGNEDGVNWSTWDDMVRQYGMQIDEPNGFGNGNAAAIGGSWY